MGRINCLEDIFPKVTHSICNLEASLQDLVLTFLVQRVKKHKSGQWKQLQSWKHNNYETRIKMKMSNVEGKKIKC